MNVNRRLLLALPVILAGPLSVRPGAAAQLLPSLTHEAPDLDGCIDTLSGYLDTLLPADGDSPSASSLGVPDRILDLARSQPPFARLVHAGCNWLNTVAGARTGRPFVDMDEKDREAVIEAAEKSARRSMPAQFFAHTYRHALESYYAHPKAWEALRYSGPPQPVGFPDYARPPPGGSA